MPRPAYIMFAESGAADQYTNSISFFNSIEAVDVQKAIPATADAPKKQKDSRYLVATWMKEDSDPQDASYEVKIECISPSGDVFFMGEPSGFTFPPGIIFHRFLVPNLHLPGYPALGVYTIEAKLRRKGEEEWFARQEYLFYVREKIEQAVSPASPLTLTSAEPSA